MTKRRKRRSDAGRPRVKREDGPQVAVPDLRAAREPFGSFSNKLHVPIKDPAYHYHWFRTDELPRAIGGGYAKVSRREAGRVLPEESAVEGNRADDPLTEKGGMGENGLYRLHLLRISRPLWEQDNKVRDRRADAVDTSISRSELQGGRTVDNMYGETSISVKTGEYAET